MNFKTFFQLTKCKFITTLLIELILFLTWKPFYGLADCPGCSSFFVMYLIRISFYESQGYLHLFIIYYLIQIIISYLVASLFIFIYKRIVSKLNK